MNISVREQLEYMAKHVSADEFRAAALREVERLQRERDAAQAEVRRLRALHFAPGDEDERGSVD